MKTSKSRRQLGAWLKQLRLDAGLSQSDVADALGYGNGQYISNMERGISFPPTNAVPVLAKLYKVSVKTIDCYVLDCAKAEVVERWSSRRRSA